MGYGMAYKQASRFFKALASLLECRYFTTGPHRESLGGRSRFVPLVLLSVLILGGVGHASESRDRVLFFGDSLTAGYGLDPAFAYPARIRAKIDEAGIGAKVVVGAVSGDTSAGGLRRIDWMLRQPVDIFVLALGANDGLRGIAPEVTKENLEGILDRVLAKNPEAKLVVAGMRLPPSMGLSHVEAFEAIYPQLAEENDAALIPDLLKDVGGVVELNLPDRIHPNAEGHEKLAENVWVVIRDLFNSQTRHRSGGGVSVRSRKDRSRELGTDR
jgi:acyl-CoA thioesterase-1